MSVADDDVTTRLRVQVVIDHPAQHFTEGLALLSDEADLDVEVLYWSLNDSGYTDVGFDREIRWDVDLTSGHQCWAPPDVSVAGRLLAAARRLHSRQPEVFLCFGWATPIARLSVLYATLQGVPLLFYGDATWQHSGRPRLRWLRAVLLGLLFRRSRTGALTTGTFNREFYLVNGMRPDRALPGVYPAVTDPFALAARSVRLEQVAAREVRIAFAGKFIERKGVADLVRAVARLPDDLEFHLSLVGDGPLRAELERLVDLLSVRHRVAFEGFKNATEMPAVLAATDILVVPSTRDMRVLVTTEGMAASAVPVVSSATAVWGAGDLVEHMITGLVFPVGDVDGLAASLRLLISSPDLRRTLSAAAQLRALEQDSDDFARLAAHAFRKARGWAGELRRRCG